jgi:succinate-acetate transporter protein
MLAQSRWQPSQEEELGMSSIVKESLYAEVTPSNGVAPEAAEKSLTWGNSGPLALSGFAVTTFMLSMVNANWINSGVEPVVFGVALMFGGLAQLIAGIIQFRTGNTFGGVLFSSYGAFWLSLFAIVQFFLKLVPPAQVGHALGLFLYAFGLFTFVMLIASFRTNIVVVLALSFLLVTFFLLAAGNYGGHTTAIHWGGYLGLVTAALAGYLATAEVCEASYGRSILPLHPLSKH